MRQIITSNWVRITKKQARIRYMTNQDLYALPCNANPESPWVSMSPIQHTENSAEAWESFLNAFSYYNCHHGMGRYPAFYITREEYDERMGRG